MVEASMLRAQQSDADISAQADNAYDAQRLVADRQIAGQVKRSLAANGVLPTGGLATQYQREISDPVYDRLNAQRAQTILDLSNARDNVRNGVTSTLSGIDNNKNQFTLSQLSNQQQAEYQRQQLLAQAQYQQASLAQQAQLASQQLAAEQARAQQQAALAQAQLDYQKQSDAQNLAFQREQAQLANQRYYSNSPSGSLGGGGNTFGTLGSSVFSTEDDRNMRANYQSMVEAERLRSGRNADGSYAGGSVTSSLYPTTSATQASRGAGGAASNAANSVSWSSGGAGGGSQYTYRNSGSNFEPVASFYTPTTGSGFSSPTSMFYF